MTHITCSVHNNKVQKYSMYRTNTVHTYIFLFSWTFPMAIGQLFVTGVFIFPRLVLPTLLRVRITLHIQYLHVGMLYSWVNHIRYHQVPYGAVTQTHSRQIIRTSIMSIYQFIHILLSPTLYYVRCQDT